MPWPVWCASSPTSHGLPCSGRCRSGRASTCPGLSCTLVVIDRIPFPRPDDPVVSARQELIDAEGGSGFAAVSVPRAALMLAQGAGRLIRSPDDRGVVAVLDSRLATTGYGRQLRRSLPTSVVDHGPGDRPGRPSSARRRPQRADGPAPAVRLAERCPVANRRRAPSVVRPRATRRRRAGSCWAGPAGRCRSGAGQVRRVGGTPGQTPVMAGNRAMRIACTIAA